MGNVLPTIIQIFLLSTTTYWCHKYQDSQNLINRLNDFYRFDHVIFLAHSSVDVNRWIPLNSATQFTPQTIYTSGGLSDQTAQYTRTSRNTFLVVVCDALSSPNDAVKLLTQIGKIRSPNINLKMGMFFCRNVTSVDLITNLCRCSWRVGIVNVFSTFHLDGDNGAPSHSTFSNAIDSMTLP